MPRIVDKREVLDGRGAVVLYGSGTSAGSFFYRELVKGSRTYRQGKIPNAATTEEAVHATIEVAFAMHAEAQETSELAQELTGDTGKSRQKNYTHKTVERQPKRQLVENAVHSFISQEQKRSDAGLITAKTRQQKSHTHTTPTAIPEDSRPSLHQSNKRINIQGLRDL